MHTSTVVLFVLNIKNLMRIAVRRQTNQKRCTLKYESIAADIKLQDIQ